MMFFPFKQFRNARFHLKIRRVFFIELRLVENKEILFKQ